MNSFQIYYDVFRKKDGISITHTIRVNANNSEEALKLVGSKLNKNKRNLDFEILSVKEVKN